MLTNLDKYSFPTKSGGLLLSSQTVPNLNMLNYTAQLLFLAKNDDLTPEQKFQYFAGIIDCEKPEGMFYRSPTNSDDTSVDDYLALSCHKQLAIDILDNSTWGFVSVKPITWKQRLLPFFQKQWLYRFAGLWTHMKISAGYRVWPLGRFVWALSIFLAAREPMSSQDSWMESHLMILTKRQRGWKSWLGDKAVQYWLKKKTKPTSQIFAEYSGISDHPLVDAWIPYG